MNPSARKKADVKKTNRGFNIYTEFTDTYGNEVRVQESSAACARRCWIFSNRDGKDAHIHLGEPQAFSPHLSPEQARRLAKALLKFAGKRKSGKEGK